MGGSDQLMTTPERSKRITSDPVLKESLDFIGLTPSSEVAETVLNNRYSYTNMR